MKKIKILFIHHGQTIGGSPISLRNTVLGLKKEGVKDIKILCAFPDMKPFFEKEACVETGDIYSPHLLFGRVMIGWANFFNPRTFIYFFIELIKAPLTIVKQVNIFKKENPDIIHLNSSILMIAAVSAKLARIPLVWHVREVVVGGRWNLRRIFTGWFIRMLADKVVCISEVEARSLGADKKNNVSVVYNFIDFSKFNCSQVEIDELKQKYNPENKKVYVSLGGVSFRKGTVEILQTAEKMPEGVFLIAGTYPSASKISLPKKFLIELLHAIENMLLSLRVKNIYSWFYDYRVEFLYLKGNLQNLKFVGKLSNVAPIIEISDALIFAGCTPHFPRPVYEAWAMKKSVVVFDMAGVSDNVEHLVDGVVCSSNDVEGLYMAIKLISSQMGLYGYNKAFDKFNMDKNIRKIIKIYEGLL